MKTFLVLSALLLSGCAPGYYEEKRVIQAEAFCVKAGFTRATPEFRECILRHYEAGAVRDSKQGQELMRQNSLVKAPAVRILPLARR